MIKRCAQGESVTLTVGSRAAGMVEGTAESWHLTCKQRAEEEWHMASETLKRTPSDMLLPARPQIPTYPNSTADGAKHSSAVWAGGAWTIHITTHSLLVWPRFPFLCVLANLCGLDYLEFCIRCRLVCLPSQSGIAQSLCCQFQPAVDALHYQLTEEAEAGSKGLSCLKFKTKPNKQAENPVFFKKAIIPHLVCFLPSHSLPWTLAVINPLSNSKILSFQVWLTQRHVVCNFIKFTFFF